jgi:hypothetical protein
MSAIESVQLDAIEKFFHSAEAFCEFIDHSDDQTTETFVRNCAASLATVYADALVLPQVEPCEETIEYPEIDTGSIYLTIHSRLRRLDSYERFFNPYDPESAAAPLLGDDLAGIYRDLRAGLELYRLGTDCAIREAVFQWQFNFRIHWGRHLVGALTALHQIIAENLLTEDERSG